MTVAPQLNKLKELTASSCSKRAVNFFMPSPRKICIAVSKENARRKKVGFIFEKVLDFLSLLWYVVVLTEKEAQPMKSMIAYLARSLF